ncbi:hypothetical protein JMJ35_000078 [Cladonia borealis]|uniref:Short-chain dehydrogenase n=1 Tax=Cladonia borealis TaxID=184061 RepID=A0AA39RB47_9LECA|nr:hypothetical protein JMJ35_000078 [Cladonia borealis]
MGAALSQVFPPAPTLTEKNLPDQTGKVFIVTGSSSGIGLELAYILYLHNATVHIAARSQPKAQTAISSIKTRAPNSTGTLHFLHLDLSDLTTIPSSASTFLSQNTRLDALINNAGVMIPPPGSKTAQGYELQLGTNCVAPFLFTKLLTPILIETAKTAPKDSVRVVWTSSNAAELFAPKGGVVLGNLDYGEEKGHWYKYGVSKAGNVYHASEFARRFGEEGIVSVSLNPGGLKTDLQRHVPWYVNIWLKHMLRDPIYGAYTELYAALSPEVNASQNGAYLVPWGRLNYPLKKDLVMGQKPEKEGGSGVAGKFWEWSEEQVKPYL